MYKSILKNGQLENNRNTKSKQRLCKLKNNIAMRLCKLDKNKYIAFITNILLIKLYVKQTIKY